jgi:hypothetical protein
MTLSVAGHHPEGAAHHHRVSGTRLEGLDVGQGQERVGGIGRRIGAVNEPLVRRGRGGIHHDLKAGLGAQFRRLGLWRQ